MTPQKKERARTLGVVVADLECRISAVREEVQEIVKKWKGGRGMPIVRDCKRRTLTVMW